MVTSTYSATYTTPAPASSTHAHIAANPAVEYPPAAAPPIIGGGRSTYEDLKPPVEQSQHGAARQPSQAGPSGNTTKLVDTPIDNLAKSELVAGSPSIKDRGIDKGGLGGAPTSQVPRVVEDAPPAYAQ